MSHFLSCFVAIALMLIATACDKPQTGTHDSDKSVQAPSKILKLAVMRDGSITADGSPITIDALGATLTDLAASKGVVWYYREGAEAEPHPNATKAVAAIIEHKLPVSMSTKPDYSDAVGLDGKSHPRQ